MSFQNTVLITAIIILVILLIVIAILIKQGKDGEVYPPQIGECPDYWQKLQDGTCHNVQGLGNSCKSPMDFRSANYTGTDWRQKRCQFAKGCGVEWDGITNVGLC